MAQANDSSRKGSRRRRRGFEAASSLLAERVQKAAEGRGFAVSRLLTHWPEIAGDKLAGLTRPVRISHGRGSFGATLTLLTTGPVAPMVEMQLPQLRDRVNACYGYNAISRILITQTAATGFAEGQAAFAPAPKKAAAKPTPEVCAKAQAATEGLADAGLRAALEDLARNILMKPARQREDLRKADP